jgi:predicted dehydrogenase
MGEDRLRIGIIGVGWYARDQVAPDLRATGRAEVVAISRRTPELLSLAQEKLGVANAYTDWRDMLERTALDAVLVSTANSVHGEATIEGWRSRPGEMGGGTFCDMGSHAVDAMLWMADAGPAQVAGFTEAAGLPVDAFLCASGRLANGVLFSCDYGSGVSGGGQLFHGDGRLTVWGDGGLLQATWTGFNVSNAEIHVEQGGKKAPVEAKAPDTSTAAAFVATVLDGTPNPCPGEQGARTVALTEAIYRSARTGEVIRPASPD